MAVFNEPTQWEHPLGNNADTSTLPDDATATAGIASLQKLFQIINATPLEAGGIAPDRADVNALFKYLGDSIFYTMNGGVPSYNADYDYVAGRVVSYNDNIYLCIQDNSALNKHAPTDAEYWLRFALNNELADYLPLAGGNLTGNLTVQNKNVVRSVNGVNADAQGNVEIQVGSFTPDYTAGVTLSNGSTAPSDGMIVCFMQDTSSSGAYVYVDGKNVCGAGSIGSGKVIATAIVEKGSTITTRGSCTITLYPFK